MKILFIDLVVAFGDTGWDFAQAYYLWQDGLWEFSIVTLCIHWVPGIVAAIHCISTKRADYGVKKTLLWAGTYIF